jgi:hypothetical protein
MLGYWPYATHKNIFYILIRKKHYLSQLLNADITVEAIKTSQK